MVGIYLIWFEGTKYTYVGQSIDVKKRTCSHLKLLKENRHYNTIIQNVFNKYGYFRWRILRCCVKNDLTKLEQYYIDMYNGKYSCNIAKKASSCLGVKRSDETKEKLRISATGRPKSAETRKKIGDSKKFLTDKQRFNLREGQRNRIITQETKDIANEKRRVFMLNISQEYKDNMRLKCTGDLNGFAKLVFNNQTGVYYGSAKSAYIDSGYKYDYFKMMLNGNAKNKTNFVYV